MVIPEVRPIIVSQTSLLVGLLSIGYRFHPCAVSGFCSAGDAVSYSMAGQDLGSFLRMPLPVVGSGMSLASRLCLLKGSHVE